MKKAILILLLSSALAQSNELDNLIESSSVIVDRMNKGVMMVGAGLEYSHHGTGLSDGTVHESAQISSAQLSEYNAALEMMSNYMPYGDVRQVLLDQAETHLDIVDEAVDVFTEAVVQMQTVTQVVEMAEAATTPNEEEQVQEFVTANVDSLQITQETVDTYNDSLESIEENANIASSFIAVANNEDAVEFLRQGAENNSTTAEMSNVAYDANMQWVKMDYNTGNASAVFLNGQSFGLDLYLTEAEILSVGSESEYFTNSPMVASYVCYFEQDC